MALAKLLELYIRELNAAKDSRVNTELELRFMIRSLDEYKRLLTGVINEAETSSVSYTVAAIKSKLSVPMKHIPGQKMMAAILNF